MQHKIRRHTVIFPDIDGVLQPPESQTRFRHDLDFIGSTRFSSWSPVPDNCEPGHSWTE